MNQVPKIFVVIFLIVIVGILFIVPFAGPLFALAFLGLLVITSIRIIQQFESALVFSLGKFDRILPPGLNFIFPLIERAQIIDMRILTIDIPKQQVITKDNVPVSINGVVYF